MYMYHLLCCTRCLMCTCTCTSFAGHATRMQSHAAKLESRRRRDRDAIAERRQDVETCRSKNCQDCTFFNNCFLFQHNFGSQSSAGVEERYKQTSEELPATFQVLEVTADFPVIMIRAVLVLGLVSVVSCHLCLIDPHQRGGLTAEGLNHPGETEQLWGHDYPNLLRQAL